MGKYSPLPWQLHQDDDNGRYFIWGGGNMVADIPERDDNVDHANAAYIVRAVNAHAALQAENAELREALKHVTRYADKQVKESQEDAILWAQLASIATEALTRPPEVK